MVMREWQGADQVSAFERRVCASRNVNDFRAEFMAGNDGGKGVMIGRRCLFCQQGHLLALAEVTAANAGEEGADQKLPRSGHGVCNGVDAKGCALKDGCAHGAYSFGVSAN